MQSLLFIALLGLAVWFWQDSLRARELAVSRARRYCQEFNYQFLDETVALTMLRPGRNRTGNFTFLREYHFEFSLDGYNRYNGTAYLIGHHLQSIQLDHPDGNIIEDQSASKPDSNA